MTSPSTAAPSREQLLHSLYEAAELEHNLMCTHLHAALGGAPRIGRGNFPLDPGYLPARVAVKLAPFNAATLQHFIHLERPEGSTGLGLAHACPSGAIEVVSGTGRMVCRITQARLCRCGGSATKPSCDGTHARNGFSAD